MNFSDFNHSVQELILYTENIETLVNYHHNIFASHISCGDKRNDLEILTRKFTAYASLAEAMHNDHFHDDPDSKIFLTEKEKYLVALYFGDDYFTHDVQDNLSHWQAIDFPEFDFSLLTKNQRISKKGNTGHVNTIILALLTTATVKDNILYLGCGKVDRTTYVKLQEVIGMLGGKWNKSKKGFIFETDPTPLYTQFIETGTLILPENLDFFATQQILGKDVVTMAAIKNGMKILEPSAGDGGLADIIAKYVPAANIDCYEKDEKRQSILRSKGYNVLGADFLESIPIRGYDRVIMNPPFSKKQDVIHTTHALKFVKPAGRLVSIMSAAVSFCNDSKTTGFRKLVSEHEGIIEENPAGSFKESGTMVNTVTVVMDLPKEDIEEPEETETEIVIPTAVPIYQAEQLRLVA